jgi:signal transduction histidine kinase
LEQILLNVINNAVKFTAEGEVAVAVRMISRENNMIQLEFSIKDTGIGMSREQWITCLSLLTRVTPVLTGVLAGPAWAVYSEKPGGSAGGRN